MTGILNLLAGAVGVVKDTYFNLVTLLLPGDGTNGAQNNTFLDSSTNNFTITRNGNTTQGTFSPFSQSGWGNYFNGSSDYLTAPAGAAFAFGTGDFSVEAWVYLNATATSQNVIASTYASTSSGFTFSLEGTGVLKVRMAGDTVQLSGGTVVTANTWHHVMVSRVSGTLRLFLDGAVDGSVADSTNSNNSTTAWNIGRLANASGYFAGYISNHRVIKGSGTSAAFTPSTTPLTAITNTQLLTCQSNRFVDNSSNAFSLTVGGTPSVQAFSPFAPTAAYSAATVGGSGYFDGTGDYLNYSPGSAFAFGTGDFTVEGWAYFSNATNEAFYFIDARNTGQTSNWAFLKDPDAAVFWYDGVNSYKSGNNTITQKNTWYHVAYTRSGTTGRIFINGVQTGGNFTDTTNYSTSVTTAYTGCRYNQIEFLTGYFGGIRVVKGTALYTSNFTPPTTPFTAVTNTSFLLNFTNAGITDATAKNVLETVGNAQISTTQSKFGGSSIYLDGTGDYLIPSPNAATLNAFGTGDFTVEFWMNSTSFANADNIKIIFDCRPLSTDGVYPTIYFSSGQIRYFVNSVDRITGSTLNTGQWYHVALCRSGTSTKLFVDGTQVGSTYTDSNNYLCGANRPVIGCRGHTLGDNNYYGYIDDLRITVGYARYTANFTPPTQSLPLQ